MNINSPLAKKDIIKVILVLAAIFMFLAIPVHADEPSIDVQFTVDGLDQVIAQQDTEFAINVRIIDSENAIDGDKKLRYKAILTRNGEKFTFGQRVYYGENYEAYFEIDEEGIAYFGPSSGFSINDIPELRNEEGVTTNFKTYFELPGSYILKLFLVDVSGGEEEIIGQSEIPIFVQDDDLEKPQPEVIFTFSGFENLEAGEINFEINCRIVDNGAIEGNVPLKYRLSLTRNGEPVVHKTVYGDRTFTTDENGVAYFEPVENFSINNVPKLMSEEGFTTSFTTELSPGNYVLTIYLVDVTNPEETEFLGKAGIKNFTVFYVSPSPPDIVVKEVFPGRDGMYDEHHLLSEVINGTRRYFIRITFEDAEDKLFFNDYDGLNYLRTSRLFPEGASHANLIDLDFLNYINSLSSGERQEYIKEYIFNKNTSAGEAYLYIPVRFLQSGTRYEVVINPNIVLAENEGVQAGNGLITWTFNTMQIPYIVDISPGSVPENYDTQEPIVIKGGFFADDVDVYFGDTRAYRVYVRNHDGESYLEVYLPRGNNRLEPGMYNVSIENSRNHGQLYYGVFSVVPGGSHIPEGDYRVIDEIRHGDIISSIKTSENKLILSTRYRNARSLEFDLDELMGTETLIRKIEFEGRRSDRIDELITKSQWADITIHGLSVINSTSRNEKATVSLGRVEPFLAQVAKSRLWNGNIKSELIQVTLDNCRITRVNISIPFHNSDGHNLKIMRYDERTRSWSNVDYYTVNLINKKVTVQDFRPGIYAVVE